MALQITNVQGSYTPSGEWISAEEASSTIRGGFRQEESPFYGGTETSPGAFAFQTPTYQQRQYPSYSTPSGSAPQMPTSISPARQPRFQSKPMFGDFGGKSTTSSRRGGGVSTAYQTWQPSGPVPTYEAGTFEAPEYDERAIAAGQQRFAAPGLRRLRREIATTQAQTYENPNVKAMTIREALQGYGSGVEQTLAGAYRTASADYERQHRAEVEERMINFRAQEEAKQKTFQAALESWSKTGTSVRGPGTGVPTTTLGQPAIGGGYTTSRVGNYTTRGTPGTPSGGF